MESSQKFLQFEQTIHQYYSEKKQKIFKKDIWEGIPPFSQQHIHKNINNKHNKCIEDITFKNLRAVLPSTIYPQSTMNLNNFTYICNNHLYPYSAIGIVIYETEGLIRYCTGSLIYKNIVITSSICCYNYQLKLPTQNLYFVVGCWSCGRYSLQKIKVVASHYKGQVLSNQDLTMGMVKESHKEQNDKIGKISNQIAILQLQKSVQKECGYFGILFRPKQQYNKVNQVKEENNNDQKQINDQKVYISGFAEIGEGGKNMYVNSSKLEQLQLTQDNLIKHSINTSYGQTGSPMYIYDQTNCKWYIIGIHLGKQQNTFDSKIGIRLTAQFRFQINNWIIKRKGQLDLSFRANGYNKILTFNNLRYLAAVDMPYLIGLSLSIYHMHIDHQNIGPLGLSELSCNLWRNIYWVELRSSKLNNKSIGYLIRCKWPQLSRLSLSQNQISGQGLKKLSKSDWHHLTVLSLCYNKISIQDCSRLHQSNWPQLSILALSNNRIKFGDSLKVFGKLSRNFKSLTWLQLYGNQNGFHNGIVHNIKEMFNNIYVYI